MNSDIFTKLALNTYSRAYILIESLLTSLKCHLGFHGSLGGYEIERTKLSRNLFVVHDISFCCFCNKLMYFNSWYEDEKGDIINYRRH
jgi:hypothetical protein